MNHQISRLFQHQFHHLFSRYETPYQTPFDSPIESPIETPLSTPLCTEKETPFESPLNTPLITPDETPFQTLQSQTPIETAELTPFITPQITDLVEAIVVSDTYENNKSQIIWFSVGIASIVLLMGLLGLIAFLMTRKRKGKIINTERKVEAMDNEDESFYEYYEEESFDETTDNETNDEIDEESIIERGPDSFVFPLYGNGQPEADEIYKGDHYHEDNTIELESDSFSEDQNLIHELEEMSKQRPKLYIF